MFKELLVLNFLPHTEHPCGFSPGKEHRDLETILVYNDNILTTYLYACEDDASKATDDRNAYHRWDRVAFADFATDCGYRISKIHCNSDQEAHPDLF